MALTPAADKWRTDHAPGALFGGLFLPPLAWLADLQVSYAAVRWTCQHNAAWVLLVVSAISFTAVISAGWLSWTGWKATRSDADETGERPMDRNYLLAVSGLSLSALFGLLIGASVIPRLLVSPCA
jgi:hypothetical protein